MAIRKYLDTEYPLNEYHFLSRPVRRGFLIACFFSLRGRPETLPEPPPPRPPDPLGARTSHTMII
eukprot:9468499-Pyramimonas_sp.AAC.1